MSLENNYISLEECKHSYLYRIDARNFGIGVFDSTANGFIGVRSKFYDEFLYTEYHYDCGAPHGTACPIKELEKCPINNLSTSDSNKELLEWIKRRSENENSDS